jgi:hypothetical protein
MRTGFFLQLFLSTLVNDIDKAYALPASTSDFAIVRVAKTTHQSSPSGNFTTPPTLKPCTTHRQSMDSSIHNSHPQTQLQPRNDRQALTTRTLESTELTKRSANLYALRVPFHEQEGYIALFLSNTTALSLCQNIPDTLYEDSGKIFHNLTLQFETSNALIPVHEDYAIDFCHGVKQGEGHDTSLTSASLMEVMPENSTPATDSGQGSVTAKASKADKSVGPTVTKATSTEEEFTPEASTPVGLDGDNITDLTMLETETIKSTAPASKTAATTLSNNAETTPSITPTKRLSPSVAAVPKLTPSHLPSPSNSPEDSTPSEPDVLPSVTAPASNKVPKSSLATSTPDPDPEASAEALDSPPTSPLARISTAPPLKTAIGNDAFKAKHAKQTPSPTTAPPDTTVLPPTELPPDTTAPAPLPTTSPGVVMYVRLQELGRPKGEVGAAMSAQTWENGAAPRAAVWGRFVKRKRDLIGNVGSGIGPLASSSASTSRVVAGPRPSGTDKSGMGESTVGESSSTLSPPPKSSTPKLSSISSPSRSRTTPPSSPSRSSSSLSPSLTTTTPQWTLGLPKRPSPSVTLTTMPEALPSRLDVSIFNETEAPSTQIQYPHPDTMSFYLPSPTSQRLAAPPRPTPTPSPPPLNSSTQLAEENSKAWGKVADPRMAWTVMFLWVLAGLQIVYGVWEFWRSAWGVVDLAGKVGRVAWLEGKVRAAG